MAHIEGTMTVRYRMSAAERIAEVHVPYGIIVGVHEIALREHDRHDMGDGMAPCVDVEYQWRLLRFPAGVSERRAFSLVLRRGWQPANPAHMLAFAHEHFQETSNKFGYGNKYVLGLGGTLHTVLGAQFGGLNHGMSFFFQHIPQDAWKHAGGDNNRFLGVRLLREL